MAGRIEISINGTAYPCRTTMGAMLRFKRETGREVSEIDAQSLSDLCTLLWCSIVSACKADGVDFNLSLMEFADSVSPDVLTAWAQQTQADTAGQDAGEAKKNRSR